MAEVNVGTEFSSDLLNWYKGWDSSRVNNGTFFGGGDDAKGMFGSFGDATSMDSRMQSISSLRSDISAGNFKGEDLVEAEKMLKDLELTADKNTRGFLDKEVNGEVVKGWGDAAFSIANLGLNAYTGWKQLGMAKDQLAFQKESFNKQMSKQDDMYADALADRKAARAFID